MKVIELNIGSTPALLIGENWKSVSVRANSIGSWFSLLARPLVALLAKNIPDIW